MNGKRTILIALLVFFASVVYSQSITTVKFINSWETTTLADSLVDSPSQINYAIIGGDIEEYKYFDSGYGVGRILGTITYEKKLEMLLYSFIMAEKYKDRHAAYDFAETIMEDFLERGVEMDSITSHIVLDYLLMAVGDGTSPFSGAEHLAAMKIYQLLCRNPWLRDEAKAAKFKEEVMDPVVKKYVNRPRKH